MLVLVVTGEVSCAVPRSEAYSEWVQEWSAMTVEVVVGKVSIGRR